MTKGEDAAGAAAGGTIADADPNLRVAGVQTTEELDFYDVKGEPFAIYGLYNPKAPGPFLRMPQEVAETVSPDVAMLCRNTAGGRVRFSTDARRLAIRTRMPSICRFPHMPLTGTTGFSLYEIRSGKEQYIHTFIPPVDLTEGYLSEKVFPKKRMRSFTIYFPLYNDVSSLEIGVEKGSVIAPGEPYAYGAPVVYYGSSITQGGCASHPGNAYSAIISRRCDCDFINLGFSGSGMGEAEIAEYIASLEMSVFVSDYDYNAPSAEHLARTLPRLVEKVREKHPEMPIVLVGHPNYGRNDEERWRPDKDTEDAGRRQVTFHVYEEALRRGDRHIRWIDGYSLYEGEDRDACTMDMLHPNDLGMMRMANVIGRVVEECLTGLF